MNAHALIAQLEAEGVRITRDGKNLRVRARRGVCIDPHVEVIRTHKPALLAALIREPALDSAIVASEAHRSLLEQIASRIARIEGRLGAADELPGDRGALRSWQAIEAYKTRDVLRREIMAVLDVGPDGFDRARYERLVAAGQSSGLFEP